ncbi:MAG: hypothetical protein LBT59_28850 [Clostridiales bacterium]|jgi:hypothetical protein|nr:hypothetical protein [Clostridiales bacterium]
MKQTKNSAMTIAVILTIVATLMFLVVKVTALFVTAYIFVLSGIAAMLKANQILLNKPKLYPWSASLMQGAISYLITEVIASAVFVILAQSEIAIIPLPAFIVIHGVIFAVFAIRLVMLNAGLETIDRVDRKTKSSTDDWKIIVTRLEMLTFKFPELKPLLEEVKYSDPVSNPTVADYAERIRLQLAGLEQYASEGNKEKVSEISSSISGLVKERNRKLKASK